MRLNVVISFLLYFHFSNNLFFITSIDKCLIKIFLNTLVDLEPCLLFKHLHLFN